jgi:hypothetical protein
MAKTPQDHRCADCPIRARAEANPRSLLARVWRWHITWCPGWKAYQKALTAQYEVQAGEYTS